MNKLMMFGAVGTLSVVAGFALAAAPEGKAGGIAAPAMIDAAVKAEKAGACAGDWKFDFETPMGAQTTTVKLTQKGTQLTGKASDPMGGETDITGTCEGDALSLSQTVQAPPGPIEITFKGKVSGNSVAGTVAFGPMGESPFTGTKQ